MISDDDDDDDGDDDDDWLIDSLIVLSPMVLSFLILYLS